MKTLYIYSLLFVACLLQSCSSFLDETPYNKITAGNFYTTAKEAEQGVNGLYSRMRDLYGSGYILYMCEAPTDIWKSAKSMDIEFQNWTIDATSGNVTKLWTNCYVTINQANAVLKALTSNDIPDLSEEKKLQYISEAKFIRAHHYYHLVQQYGDVELKTEPTEALVTEAYKTPAVEIWNFIIDEMKYCIENLPDDQNVYGRITKEAVKHNLARVYLTVKRNDEDIKEAKRLAEEVIVSSHSLMSSHEELWNTDNMRNPEVLLPVLFTTNTELNGEGQQLHVMFTASYSDHYPKVLERDLTYGRPWSRIRPTYYLQELYDETKDARWEDCYRTFWRVNKEEATDMIFSPYSKKEEEIVWRKGDSVMIIPKHPWTKEQVKAVWPVWVWMPDEMREELQDKVQSETNPNGEWPSNTKFQSGTMYTTLIKLQDPLRPSANEMKGVRDIVVFRLGETYLLAAEACHLLGDNKKAAEYMNVIRKRRWYDLKRTGKLYERMNNPDMNEIVAGKFQKYHVLRPIPRDQLARISNPEDFPQNEGYGN